MYSSADWLNGKTCATLLATIGGEGAAAAYTVAWARLLAACVSACFAATCATLLVQLVVWMLLKLQSALSHRFDTAELAMHTHALA